MLNYQYFYLTTAEELRDNISNEDFRHGEQESYFVDEITIEEFKIEDNVEDTDIDTFMF